MSDDVRHFPPPPPPPPKEGPSDLLQLARQLRYTGTPLYPLGNLPT